VNPDPETLPPTAVEHYDAALPADRHPAGPPDPQSRTSAELARAADVAELAAIDAKARLDSRATSTREAYRRQWEHFEDWCLSEQICPCPASPTTVRAYLATRRRDGLSVASLGQVLAAIWARHRAEGRPSPARTDPALREALQGYARQDRDREIHQMSALLTSHAKRIISTMDTTLTTQLAATQDERVERKHLLIDQRDRAVILFGTASALRRSSLVTLTTADLGTTDDGLEFTLRWSKADQAGTRRKKRAVPRGTDVATCPVTALQTWLTAAEIASGPLFRNVSMWGKVGAAMSPQSIRLIVKQRAEDAQLPGTWGAHSLRAGFATQASKNGASLMAVKDHGDWASDAVFAYFRDAEIWQDPAAGYLGY
jgi:site-specific recombinase XerD